MQGSCKTVLLTQRMQEYDISIIIIDYWFEYSSAQLLNSSHLDGILNPRLRPWPDSAT